MHYTQVATYIRFYYNIIACNWDAHAHAHASACAQLELHNITLGGILYIRESSYHPV